MKKILLVEDDKVFRKSLELVLKKHFEVDSAGALKEALEKIRGNGYAFVITDGAFPEYEGGILGNHGRLEDRDYRGNIVGRAAKERGIYVIGLSMEPERLKEVDEVVHKGKFNLTEYLPKLKEIS